MLQLVFMIQVTERFAPSPEARQSFRFPLRNSFALHGYLESRHPELSIRACSGMQLTSLPP